MNTINNETYQYHMPLDEVPSEELKITSVAFLPNTQSKFNQERDADQPRLSNILQNDWPVFFKSDRHQK